MNRPRHHVRPLVEGCETRSLMSGGLHLAAAPAVKAPYEIDVHLNGTFRGHYVEISGIPDTGSTTTLTGSGHVTGIKHAVVAGSFHSIGFIQIGDVPGALVLAGPRGSLTLDLTGPPHSNGPAGLPDQFHYHVVEGTGKYAHDADEGEASLVLVPGHSTTGNAHLARGAFTLVLTSQSTQTV